MSLPTRRIAFVCAAIALEHCVLPEVALERVEQASPAEAQNVSSDGNSGSTVVSGSTDGGRDAPASAGSSGVSGSGSVDAAGATPPGGGASPPTAGASEPETSPTASAGNAATTTVSSGTAGSSGAMPDDASGTDALSAGTAAAAAMTANTSSCGPEVKTSARELGDPMIFGPFTPAHVEATGPASASWIFYPAELNESSQGHPIFQWSPGAGTGPSNYTAHLNLLASHGFVVISQASTENGKQALDWLLSENTKAGSMWYQKLDTKRVGRGGHSMGSLQTLSEANDDRLSLYVLVCGGCQSGSGGCGASAIDDPAIFLGGQGLGDTINFEGDYAEVSGPTVFVRRTSTDHIACARDNLAPWVAFMRWHLCGEEKWKKEFEAGGAYCTGDWAACETKNL